MEPKTISTRDSRNLNILSITLLLPLLIEAFTVFNHGPKSIFTACVYALFLSSFLIWIRKQITVRDVFTLLGLYSFFIINIILFPSSLHYYTSVNMIMVLVFYLPICSFVIRHIHQWEYIFIIIRPYALISVLLGAYMVFLSDISQYEDYFTYMEFSYCMLPFACSLYIAFRTKKSIFWLVLFGISSSCMILYGARATTIFLLLFIISYELVKAKPIYRVFILVICSIIALLITINFDSIIYYLSTIESLKDSRFIAKIVAGEFTDGGERDMLIEQSITRIQNMELDISGIFGDRKYIRGVYPHNIFLEILMQFGLFIGGGILVCLFCLVYVDIFNYRYPMVTIFLCCVLFSRFFISGSYIQEGSFWLWLFSLLSIYKQQTLLKFSITAKPFSNNNGNNEYLCRRSNV